MGSPAVSALVKKRTTKTVKEKNISDYIGYTVGLDVFILLYRFLIAILSSKGDHMRTKRGKITSHIYGLFYKLLSLLTEGILPVPVLDGKPPSIKKGTIEERQQRKQKAQEKLSALSDKEDETTRIKLKKQTISVNGEIVKDTIGLLTLLGLPFVRAPSESDASLAALNKANLIGGVASDDSDVLLFGAKRMLKNFSGKNKVVLEIDLHIMLEELEISHSNLIDISIFTGDDYSEGIKGLGPLFTYDELVKEISFNNFMNIMEFEHDVITKLEREYNHFINIYKKHNEGLQDIKVIELILSYAYVNSNYQKMFMFLKYLELKNGLSPNILNKLKKRYSTFCPMRNLFQKIKQDERFEIPLTFENQWSSAKDYYERAEVIDTNKHNELVWNEPNYKALREFLVDENEFNGVNIDRDLEKIKKIYEYYHANGVLKNFKMPKKNKYTKQSRTYVSKYSRPTKLQTS